MPALYPTTPEGIASLASRFWSKVNKDGPTPEHCPELGPCWVWTASADRRGYGKIGVGGAHTGWVRAPRVSYFLFHGFIPPNLFVLHECDNPSCVRPSHLSVGTNADNMHHMTLRKRHIFYRHPEITEANRKKATESVRGIANPWCKLTETQVLEIRRRYASGEIIAKIARDYPVCSQTVRSIVYRLKWMHVVDPNDCEVST